MGAYGEGSIERLCDLIDPDHAIITSIGLAHNERFKGLDVVARAKSELAQWVATKGSAGRIVMTRIWLATNLLLISSAKCRISASLWVTTRMRRMTF